MESFSSEFPNGTTCRDNGGWYNGEGGKRGVGLRHTCPNEGVWSE